MENKDIIFEKGFIGTEISNALFKEIKEKTEWHSILKNKDGEDVTINRAMAYQDANYKRGDLYKYANLLLPASGLSMEIEFLIFILNANKNYCFNSCLLNLYKDGRDEIRWHSDKEEQLKDKPVIAMVNLGASRTFHMLNKNTGEKQKHLLENGDLFVMLENCQENWLHAVLKEKQVKEPRISLTFRKTY